MMEGFMSYFGGRRDPNKTARDAIIGLKQQLTVLEKKEEFLHQKIDVETKKAKANAVSNKPAAMAALRRKKQSETELERLMGTQLQLEMQINTLESANLNAETMAAIRKASKALGDIHAGLTVAKVENIMDKLGQEMETQKEIQNAISTDMIGTGIDDDSLLQELHELEEEQLNERLVGAENVPIHTPAGPSAIDDSSRRRAEEEDEEAQLKELQAALAM